jgi:hypothetical protein
MANRHLVPPFRTLSSNSISMGSLRSAKDRDISSLARNKGLLRITRSDIENIPHAWSFFVKRVNIVLARKNAIINTTARTTSATAK